MISESFGLQRIMTRSGSSLLHQGYCNFYGDIKSKMYRNPPNKEILNKALLHYRRRSNSQKYGRNVKDFTLFLTET